MCREPIRWGDRTISSFESETDADLLAYMAMAGDDPDGAREAYGVFYERHAGWLLQTIRSRAQLMRSFDGEAGAFDLVQDTFMRAYEKAGTFDPGGISDAAQIRRRARAWLARIATNLHLDAFRKGSVPGGEPTVAIEELTGFDPPEREEDEVELHAQQLREEIEKLPEQDQDVLWTWAEFYKPGEEHQRLPDEESQALARRWNTTSQAIRQRRRRLFERLKKKLTH